eukprot:UN00998
MITLSIIYKTILVKDFFLFSEMCWKNLKSHDKLVCDVIVYTEYGITKSYMDILVEKYTTENTILFVDYSRTNKKL